MGSISLVMSKKDIKISIHGLNLPCYEQKYIKLPMYRCLRKFGTLFFWGVTFFITREIVAHSIIFIFIFSDLEG